MIYGSTRPLEPPASSMVGASLAMYMENSSLAASYQQPAQGIKANLRPNGATLHLHQRIAHLEHLPIAKTAPWCHLSTPQQQSSQKPAPKTHNKMDQMPQGCTLRDQHTAKTPVLLKPLLDPSGLSSSCCSKCLPLFNPCSLSTSKDFLCSSRLCHHDLCSQPNTSCRLRARAGRGISSPLAQLQPPLPVRAEAI